MNFLYIGQYTSGTTSKMRADKLKALLPVFHFEVIDTNVPYLKSGSLSRSLGFRYKIGPVVKAVNRYIDDRVDHAYDVVWIDKGIFLKEKTVAKIREKTRKLVHFTPDAAFLRNRSRLFEKNIPYYDHLITTKSFETEYYRKFKCKDLILTTQGFDPQVHRPYHRFAEKERDIVFIGLCEPHRESLILKMVSSGLNVSVGGKKWMSFCNKHKQHQNLEYLGDQIYENDYARLISSSKMALGLLSKIFPELHTTRTFEIPACGTALITEWNKETAGFFNEEEVLFYDTETELINKTENYLKHPEKIKAVSERGYQKVMEGGYSYESILQAILNKCL